MASPGSSCRGHEYSWLRLAALFCAATLLAGIPVTSHALGEAVNGFPKWEERVIHAWMNRARSDPQVEMTTCGANCGEKACYSPIAPLSYDLNLNHAARFHADEMAKQNYFAHNSACTVVSNINSLYPSSCDGSASCACVGGTQACSPTCTTPNSRVPLFGTSFSGEIIATMIPYQTPIDPNQAFYLWLYENSADPTCAFSGTNGHRWLILKATGAVGAGSSGPAVGDFGPGAAPARIPSGSHYPRQSSSVDAWANWYDGAGPSVARINVDGACTPMTLGRGTTTNGAYTANLTNVASGCHRYYFEFKDSGNQVVSFPTSGSLGIGPAGSCADWDVSRATSCFAIVQFTLAVTLAGTGSGSVSSGPAGISCGATCSAPYDSGTMVTLTATPAGNSLFGGWSGGGCGGTGTCVVTVTAATNVTATFTAKTAPDAPVILSAAPGNAQVTVAFNPPPSDGGSPVTQYTAQCAGTPTVSNTGPVSPITISGLTNGNAYSCGVTATNAIGTSVSSGLIFATPNTGSPLALVAVKSRKLHGTPPPFDLQVDFTVPIAGPISVEPRNIGTGHTIVFQFNQPVTVPGSVSVVDALGAPIGVTTAPVVTGTGGNEVSVLLTSIPDNKRVKITLTGVAGNFGGNVNAVTSLGFLVGDVNGTRMVTASDISGTKAHQGQVVNGSNFRFDVNLSGDITPMDTSAVKARPGIALP